MIKLLIIDLDGTLVDSRQDITESLNLTLKEFKFNEIDESIVSKHVGVGITPLISEVVPKEELTKFLKKFEKNYIKNITNHTLLYSDWDYVFDQTPNLKKIILSNKSQTFCDPLINKLKLNKHFESIYGGEAFKEKKPSALPILEISIIHNIPLAEMMIIGDTINDINSGKSAGIKTCAAEYGYSEIEEISRMGADYIIKKPEDILAILNNE